MRYVDLWFRGAIGTELRLQFFRRPGSRNTIWGARSSVHIHTTEWTRYHLPIEDFFARNAKQSPVDLTQPTSFRLVVVPPAAGVLDTPEQQRRQFQIDNLRLSRHSAYMSEAISGKPIGIQVHADKPTGVMTRPWEGIINYPKEHRALLRNTLGMRFSRLGPLSINDWQKNSRLIKGVGDYDLKPFERTARALERYQGYSYQWIPTIPQALWRERNPSKRRSTRPDARPVGAISPPADYAAWERVLTDLVRYQSRLTDRVLGYSIGNEPDSGYFWAGTAAEYNEFYARSAIAIKKANPDAKVIGPSYAKFSVSRMKAFLDACAARDAPLDYLSWHHYMHGQRGDELLSEARTARALLQRYPQYRNAKLLNNEWGYALAPVFEERNRGLIGASGVASALWAMVEGGYEMGLFFKTAAQNHPVYWGSGLFDFDNRSARPMLYTFSLFGQLGPTRLEAHTDAAGSGVNTLASTTPSGEITVLFWWYRTGNGREQGTRPVTLRVHNAKKDSYTIQRQSIDHERGTLVKGRGYHPLPAIPYPQQQGPDLTLSLELPLYGVTLVRFTPN